MVHNNTDLTSKDIAMVHKDTALAHKDTSLTTKDIAMVHKDPTLVDMSLIDDILQHLPDYIDKLIKEVGKRSRHSDLMDETIVELCAWRDFYILNLPQSYHDLAGYVEFKRKEII